MTKAVMEQKVTVPERFDAHKLIEEFMIQANVAAAEELEEENHPYSTAFMKSHIRKKLRPSRQFLKTDEPRYALGPSYQDPAL